MRRPLRFALAAVLTFASATAQAQRAPTAEVLLGDWLRGQAEAARGVERVEVTEHTERRIAGPRGETHVEARGRVVHRPGARPERRVEGVRVDGRDVPADRLARLDERLGRAFGPGAGRLADPALVPAAALARTRPDGPATADRVGPTPAWRVALRAVDGPQRGHSPPLFRALAWFTQDPEPRLLRVRFDLGGPRGRIVRTVDAERVDGLDVPALVESRAEIRQTRRLRDYATTVRVTTTYGRPVVVRR